MVVAGEAFEVEVAVDPMDRMRGLSGRTAIPRNGGMLFVLPRPEPMSMVMRDCPIPIDVAFIDAMGRVVAIHEMTPEPPREPVNPRFATSGGCANIPAGSPSSSPWRPRAAGWRSSICTRGTACTSRRGT